MITRLDGPLGTELSARGVATDSPIWSAAAIDVAAEVIAEIHRDYAAAGATVHTANTFRTKRRYVGDQWQRLSKAAVDIARSAVPSSHRIAASIAPLADCYRPDLSPPDPRPEHREMAQALAELGVDLLLCETFPHVEEAIIAVEESVRTGVETWLALTAGPSADLMTPQVMAQAARRAAAAGAAAVLVNCTPATDSLRFVEALAEAELGLPIGVYANAGSDRDRIGWDASSAAGVEAYARLAKQWRSAGATIIGGCCGTGPKHIAVL